MLYLIGIGLMPKQLTLEAIEAIKQCDQVFLEGYTSQYSEGVAEEVTKITGKHLKLLGRKEVEEEFESALVSARRNNIALLVFGNPLTATTHIQLLLDAKEKGIRTKVVPGISITNTLAETGLDEYKFGRTVTVCYHTKGYEPDAFYKQIKQNQRVGLHTLCLLDIKKDEKPQRLMNCVEAIEVLEKIAGKNEDNKLFGSWVFVAMLGMGSERQKVIVGKEKILKAKELFEVFPQSMVVCGKINEKEKEALEKLHKN